VIRVGIRTSHGEPGEIRSAFTRALEGESMALPEALAAFVDANPTSRLADDVRAGASGSQVVWYSLLIAGTMVVASVPELSARME
jgi:hypothetical protein